MREDEYDYRWLRIGWFDQERPCDVAVQFATAQLPGETLPQRWSASSPTLFVKKFGEGVRWSKTASYHLLWISGQPVLRIWTNAKTKTLIEVSDRLLPWLQRADIEVEKVPEGTKKRRGEFNWRFNLKYPAELNYLMTVVKVLYGVGEARV